MFIYHWHSGGGIEFEKTIQKSSRYNMTRLLVEKLMLIKYNYKSKINFNPYIDGFECYSPLSSEKHYHYYNYAIYIVVCIFLLVILFKCQNKPICNVVNYFMKA